MDHAAVEPAGADSEGSDPTVSAAASSDAAGDLVASWRDRGELLDSPEGRVFVVDTAASVAVTAPPLVVLHGFPTSSFDFRTVLDTLCANRRVILFDQIGFGLSDKPDRRYGIHLHADTAAHVIAELGIEEFDLLTHDMGDSVGGELLARDLDGSLGRTIRRRVITNGSIYLELAQLTIGQQLLMGLPDEATDELAVEGFVNGVTGTFAEASPIDLVDAAAHGLIARNNGGLRLMARLIRYLEDRQAEESRYTGAIESHPSPLQIVWGDLDPVAVVAMAHRLAGRRADRSGEPGGRLEILEGVGHYPMIEAPERFAAAVLRGLT